MGQDTAAGKGWLMRAGPAPRASSGRANPHQTVGARGPGWAANPPGASLPIRDNGVLRCHHGPMTDVERSSPEAAYLTKPNIVHPQSGNAAVVAAAEAAGRADIALRKGGVAVTGGAIKKGN
jgi:hypothetical protein